MVAATQMLVGTHRLRVTEAVLYYDRLSVTQTVLVGTDRSSVTQKVSVNPVIGRV